MDYIIDANILFSALISGKVVYKTLLERYHCISSDYLFVELERYQETVKTKTKMDGTQFTAYSVALFSKINIIPALLLSDKAKSEALELCNKVDIDDTPYIALAIDLGVPLITRDIKLYNGLRKQKFKNIVLLQDLLNTL